MEITVSLTEIPLFGLFMLHDVKNHMLTKNTEKGISIEETRNFINNEIVESQICKLDCVNETLIRFTVN